MASENSNPDTLADLSKHLRDWADKLPEEEDGAWFERPAEQMQEILRDLADKIDAAWKIQMSQSWNHREMTDLIMRQEKEVIELKKSVGNQSSMRKALIDIADICDGKGVGAEIKSKDEDRLVVYNIAKHSLFAPARNCDRFATVKDAAIAFSKFRNNPHPCPDFTFSAWLMSATEEGAEA